MLSRFFLTTVLKCSFLFSVITFFALFPASCRFIVLRCIANKKYETRTTCVLMLQFVVSQVRCSMANSNHYCVMCFLIPDVSYIYMS